MASVLTRDQAFQLQGLALPLSVSTTDIGSVLDANGTEVFVVDFDRDWSDAKVIAIAVLIVAAVHRETRWEGGR